MSSLSIRDRRGTLGSMLSQRVLVVDDEESIRDLIATALRRKRLQVVTAANGEDAIQKLRAQPFGVVTLDLMMPRLSGWDVIDWLKGNPRMRPSSLVVITAADYGVFHKLDPSVVNAILIKPFDIGVLAAYVVGALKYRPDRRRARVIGLAPPPRRRR